MLDFNGDSKIYLCCGVTDMRKGIKGLSLLASEVVMNKPLESGALFVFRGLRSDRLKILWWDGQGFCLFYKCLDRGKFTWPRVVKKDGQKGVDKANIRVTKAQLMMLIEGIDWRNPTWSNPPRYLA